MRLVVRLRYGSKFESCGWLPRSLVNSCRGAGHVLACEVNLMNEKVVPGFHVRSSTSFTDHRRPEDKEQATLRSVTKHQKSDIFPCQSLHQRCKRIQSLPRKLKRHQSQRSSPAWWRMLLSKKSAICFKSPLSHSRPSLLITSRKNIPYNRRISDVEPFSGCIENRS